MGAFRTADGFERLEAPVRGGTLTLEVAPRHVAISRTVKDTIWQLTITEEFVTLIHRTKTGTKRTSERLAGALVVARDVPHEDLGMWLEVAPDQMKRVFGAQPFDLISEQGLDALRSLDRLAQRLRQVLAPYARGAARAFEVGRGLDKVLVVDHRDRMVVYARRLFRDSAKRVVEVRADGTVLLPTRHGDARFEVRERFGVTVTGDFIRFIDRLGTDLGRVALPWIDPEDRLELARRFGEMVERRLSEPAGLTATP